MGLYSVVAELLRKEKNLKNSLLLPELTSLLVVSSPSQEQISSPAESQTYITTINIRIGHTTSTLLFSATSSLFDLHLLVLDVYAGLFET